MTAQEKATYVDAFLRGLDKSSFASSLANILELSRLPSEENKRKFKMLEFDIERLGLVQLIRGRDNSTLGGQCEYLISDKGLNYVMYNKSTIELFKKEKEESMENINWTRVFNRYFKLINNQGTPEYVSGSKFLDMAREANDNLPGYSAYIDQLNAKGKSTSRKDYYLDVLNQMTEDERHVFYEAAISELEKTQPEGLNDLKELFKGSGQAAAIKKRTIPSKDMPDEVYKDVLGTLYNTYRNAEQKPSIYKGKGEEDLRDIGLMMLESRYESTVAAGEAFNKVGKTDIILKSDNGSNLFVAECKVWHGAAQFHDALNQLFGYLTWRDTKSTLIFFVRNADFTGVLAKIKEEAQKHPLFIKHVGDRAETSFSYLFKYKDDLARQIQIEIMAFAFPPQP